MGHTKDFFKSKKGWSLLKDKIFDHYLKPYIAKILTTGKPLIIIDCFAGRGKFDDGNVGSPIIIAEHIKSVLYGDNKNKNISGIFIEKKYINELETNIQGYKQCGVWKGTFEENLGKILALNSRCNLFLYIDPYGIKSLDFKQFELIKNKNYFSLEMLLNFNSFGFLREGCRLLNLNYEKLFVDYGSEDEYEIDETNNIANMNNIANGVYWQSIIDDYNSNKIGMYKAEELFTNEYVKQFKDLFKHVANIPIKIKTKNIPKYRLIFGTNNQDGLILMADNMNKKWKELLNTQRGGQLVLFEYEFPDLSIQPNFDLKENILKILMEHKKPLLLKELLVKLIEKYGISFSETEYKNKIRELEEESIIIERKPEYTKTGAKTTSLEYRKFTIYVRLNEK